MPVQVHVDKDLNSSSYLGNYLSNRSRKRTDWRSSRMKKLRYLAVSRILRTTFRRYLFRFFRSFLVIFALAIDTLGCGFESHLLRKVSGRPKSFFRFARKQCRCKTRVCKRKTLFGQTNSFIRTTDEWGWIAFSNGRYFERRIEKGWKFEDEKIRGVGEELWIWVAGGSRRSLFVF